MKIRIRYDNEMTTIDVPEEEFSVMVRLDYEERLAQSDDPASVSPRTPQEIMDERFNRPDYNNWHKETRHRASYDQMAEKGGLLCDSAAAQPVNRNGKTLEKARPLLGRRKTLEEEVFGTEEDELYTALEALPEAQRELLLEVYADGADQQVIAEKAGVSKSAVSHRKERALEKLRKELEKKSVLLMGSSGYPAEENP